MSGFSGRAPADQAAQEAGTSTNLVVTPGVQKMHPSAAKAWVYFDGKTGSTATILASFGVSGVVRNSAGVYTVTWSTAFSSANYGVQVLCSDPSTTVGFPFLTGTPLTASTLLFEARNALAPATAVDCAVVMVVAYGDQ